MTYLVQSLVLTFGHEGNSGHCQAKWLREIPKWIKSKNQWNTIIPWEPKWFCF